LPVFTVLELVFGAQAVVVELDCEIQAKLFEGKFGLKAVFTDSGNLV
jgi:hypothetical protein